MLMSVQSTTPLPSFFYACTKCKRDLKFAFADEIRVCPVCQTSVPLPVSIRTVLQARKSSIIDEPLAA